MDVWVALFLFLYFLKIRNLKFFQFTIFCIIFVIFSFLNLGGMAGCAVFYYGDFFWTYLFMLVVSNVITVIHWCGVSEERTDQDQQGGYENNTEVGDSSWVWEMDFE